HAELRRMPFARRADEDAAVSVLRAVVLHLEFEIAVLILRAEPPSLAAFADDLAVFPGPAVRAAADRLPAGEVFPVEQRSQVVLQAEQQGEAEEHAHGFVLKSLYCTSCNSFRRVTPSVSTSTVLFASTTTAVRVSLT